MPKQTSRGGAKALPPMPGAAMLSASEIRSVHRALELAFKTYVDSATIPDDPDTETRWDRTNKKDEVVFLLTSPEAKAARYVTGARAPVHPLRINPSGADKVAWFSWREEWISRGSRLFAVKGFSFNFFWGYSNAPL